MKKCPTCNKTFDEAMKFCQTDGTPLVEVTETTPNDPYKTMVAGKEDIASAVPPDPFQTMVGTPPINIEDDEEVLEIPEKPAFLRETESSQEKGAGEISKPPVSYLENLTPTPETQVESSSFDNISKPEGSITNDKTSIMNTGSSFDKSPSDFDSIPLPDQPSSSRSPFGNSSTPPIPSPFDQQTSFDQPTSAGFEPPPVPEFKVEEIKAEALNTPYAEEVRQEPPPYRQTEWTPPPAPVQSWQNQDIGQNTPFQPPVAGSQGDNKTLAIISLVCGIVSLLCCTTLLPGIAAVITGFIARKNASENPNEYGGSGMALAGIITGSISVIIGIIFLILYIFTGVLAGIGNM